MRDKEELLSSLFVGYVSPYLNKLAMRGTKDSVTGFAKLRALERYMRSYLRALTVGELEYELELVERNHGVMSAEVLNKIDKASQGYDTFMAKRHKVAV